ncbi:MAG: thioredoxin domain-containing protein [Armatimonadota bacterium]
MLIRKPNRLIDERSPYLLQHAYNPVEWYPWGAEAFLTARAEDKPIFLSIGYSTCHWCHVMAHESFEHPQIAEILNRYFVPVKVDREERPDVDELYVTAVQLMAGSAGWPLSVFLTTDGTPFYGGTYYPPQAFADLLQRVAIVWQQNRAQVLSGAQQVKEALQQVLTLRQHELRGVRNPNIFRAYKAQLMSLFDPQYGGLGGAPKFPPNTALPLMLDLAVLWDDEELGTIALTTLNFMVQGGIYDHLAGGFHRYATDTRWFLPHFEKMLSDNAQLVRAYLKAYHLSGEPLYAEVAKRTLDWMLTEMSLPEGVFTSAVDADSPEGEGYYYTWTEREIYEVLGPEDGALFCAVYGVEPEGNYREEANQRPTGRNVLAMQDTLQEIAQQLGLQLEVLQARLAPLREKLLQVRRTRQAPARDDKALTDWNALAICALLDAFDILGEPAYLDHAEKIAQFMWRTVYRQDGTLMHCYRQGQAYIPGFLSDYALFGLALTQLYEVTGDPEWQMRAQTLADQMIARFADQELGGFYDTHTHHDWLLLPIKSYHDRALPSGNGAACQFLATLAKGWNLSGADNRYARLAGDTLNAFWGLLEQNPYAGSSLLMGYRLLAGTEMPKPNMATPTPFEPADTETQAGPVKVYLVPQPEGLVVVFDIEEGWHIYSSEPVPNRVPTQIAVSSDLPLEFGEPIWMPAKTISLGGEEVAVYTERAEALVPIAATVAEASGEGYIRVRVVYQPCTERDCGLPVTREFVLPVNLRES